LLYGEIISESFKELDSSLSLGSFSTRENPAELKLLENLKFSVETYRTLRHCFLSNTKIGGFACRLAFLPSGLSEPFDEKLIPCINLLYTSWLSAPIKIDEGELLQAGQNPSAYVAKHLNEHHEKVLTVFSDNVVKSNICGLFNHYVDSWNLIAGWKLKIRAFVYFPSIEKNSREADNILVRCILYPGRLPNGRDSQNRFSTHDFQTENITCRELFKKASVSLYGTWYTGHDLGSCREVTKE
jgi:hypothetical protein